MARGTIDELGTPQRERTRNHFRRVPCHVVNRPLLLLIEFRLSVPRTGVNGMAQKLQSRRFEYKYIISERAADGIRDFIRGRMTLDEHDDPENPQGYPVCSLYLDSPQLTLYDQTAKGHKNRFKLRIRFYDDNNKGPAFLEIKRRENDVIRKQRVAVTRQGALQILKGGWPVPSMLHKPSGNMDALERFCNLTRSINADGCAYVLYRREAYVSPDSDQLRITLDRELVGGMYHAGSELAIPTAGAHPYVGGVVFEMKFTDRFPPWMHELAQTFNLQRTSVPKYCLCVEALNLARPGWVRKTSRIAT